MAIKLMFILALSLFFCGTAFSQTEKDDTLDFERDTLFRQIRELERELMELVEKGVDANIISAGLRDTIIQFIRNTKMLASSRSLNFGNLVNNLSIDSLPPNKIVIMRDGIPIVVDTAFQKQLFNKKQLELSLEKSPRQTLDYAASRNIKNGVNSSMLFPDRLPVPEREGRGKKKNKYQYMSQEELKKNIIRADYFSKGLDGYYSKFIAIGHVGEGWVETREMYELVASIKAGLQAATAASMEYSKEPEFIGKMSKSRNPLVKFMGGLLRMLNNAALGQVHSGYKNPNPMIKTPPAPSQR